MSKYTPGPWLAQGDDGCTITPFVAGDRLVKIGEWHEGRGMGSAAAANVRLIAAAPDLLEALKTLLDYDEDELEAGFLAGDIAKAREAVAKAEGASP
jgi:hypothetical protein